MGDLAAGLEASALAATLRGSLWLYPLVNLAHVLGVALLFGAVAVLDLRLLGLWRDRLPVADLAAATLPVALAGFVLAAASGAALLSVEAGGYVLNPMLWAKLGAIALACANAAWLHRSAKWRGGAGRGLPLAGLVSLGAWGAAIAAGRMIAYW